MESSRLASRSNMRVIWINSRLAQPIGSDFLGDNERRTSCGFAFCAMTLVQLGYQDEARRKPQYRIPNGLCKESGNTETDDVRQNSQRFARLLRREGQRVDI